ncbi:DUF4872 domain-containing protein [Occultella kanbiaonis]|uniref:DUF4872 domain-containing protein n=1 Tax=Occultella kanbiaonis TaxID=2675754 RepID=UPI0013D0F377|nr:DUF4872 domain-containing protein [Occultella kanbiaonis]
MGPSPRPGRWPRRWWRATRPSCGRTATRSATGPLPEFLDGQGGHPVVAYAGSHDRVHVDDRTLASLTVPTAVLDQARARVGSHKNTMFVVQSSDTVVPADRLRAAVRDGLAETVDHLTGSSTSFAVPAWRKWSRMLVDQRAAKGWPTVFADRRGLLRALAGVWESVETAGMDGGHLRGLFADGLAQAAAVLEEPALAGEAQRWREIGQRWHLLAETALPEDVPAIVRLRELTATVTGAVAAGDPAAAQWAAAADRCGDCGPSTRMRRRWTRSGWPRSAPR